MDIGGSVFWSFPICEINEHFVALEGFPSFNGLLFYCGKDFGVVKTLGDREAEVWRGHQFSLDGSGDYGGEFRASVV